MDDLREKKVLIVDAEQASRRTLGAMVAMAAAAEARPAPAPEPTLEQRVRARLAAIEAGKVAGRHKEAERLRRWLGQGPRKEPRLEVAPGEELKLGGYVLTVLKVKKDGRLRVAWNGGRPNAGHVVSVKGWPYHVVWATAREVGLKPGSPPLSLYQTEMVGGIETAIITSRKEYDVPQPTSLKKQWKAQHLKRRLA